MALPKNISALLIDAAECMRQGDNARAHRLASIASRAANRDRTLPPHKRDAVHAVRLLCAAAI